MNGMTETKSVEQAADDVELSQTLDLVDKQQPVVICGEAETNFMSQDSDTTATSQDATDDVAPLLACDLKAYGVYTPATLVAAVKSQKSQPYLIEGIVRRKSVNLLVGDSGLGKTPLAIQAGLCVAAGVPFLRMNVEKGRVLYCDAESDLAGFSETVETIVRFLTLKTAPDDFMCWSPNWNDGKDVSETYADWSMKLVARVQTFKPTLVVVDSLRMFWPKAETKNADAADMLTRLKKVSRNTGATWLICHHRRKVNQQAYVPPLDENPHAWFQEAAGAHGLVNQSDTRLGVVPHDGQADLLLAGFVRGTGAIAPLDLARVVGEDGSPIGYRLLRGVEHLNPDDRVVFEKLATKFRFKDAQATMGGNSGSNATRFLKKCVSLGIARKEDAEYVKTAQSPIVEHME